MHMMLQMKMVEIVVPAVAAAQEAAVREVAAAEVPAAVAVLHLELAVEVRAAVGRPRLRQAGRRLR